MQILMTISKFSEDEDLINVRNEVDRFGFSHFLANKMQIKNPPRSFASLSVLMAS